jgi:hypothetical protein
MELKKKSHDATESKGEVFPRIVIVLHRVANLENANDVGNEARNNKDSTSGDQAHILAGG